MSILDNIKGHRGVSEGEPGGGKFNPFKLLSIGEIMVRYTDGIRIKDFVFLAVLTSERLILIDSTRQGSGQITKEIPFSVIKQADLERDEKDRPTLAISMEVGDQSRIMRLVFTGLIDEPETECREWFTAINGYPPERSEMPELRLDEPAGPPPQIQQKKAEPEPEIRSSVMIEPPEPVPTVEVKEEIPGLPPSPPLVQTPASVSVPPPQPTATAVPPPPTPPHRVSIPKRAQRRRTKHQVRQVPVTPVPEGSVRIFIEKPDVSPFHVPIEPPGEGGERITTSWKFCIHCGARTPSHARFCQSCGIRQT